MQTLLLRYTRLGATRASPHFVNSNWPLAKRTPLVKLNAAVF